VLVFFRYSSSNHKAMHLAGLVHLSGVHTTQRQTIRHQNG
jgi:hypothetical protein